MRKNSLSSLGLILPFLPKDKPKPIYDIDIDMSMVLPSKSKSFEHNTIIISNKHSIYRRHKGVRPSLPYQGIARNPEIFMLSFVNNPVDPKCKIKKIS